MRKLKESVRLLAIAGMFFLFFTAVLYQRGVFDFSFKKCYYIYVR